MDTVERLVAQSCPVARIAWNPGLKLGKQTLYRLSHQGSESEGESRSVLSDFL